MEDFSAKLTAEIDVLIGYFVLPSLMLTLEVCSLFILYFMSILYAGKFEQNRAVQITQNSEFFFYQKKE